jgi:hypothetical protein
MEQVYEIGGEQLMRISFGRACILRARHKLALRIDIQGVGFASLDFEEIGVDLDKVLPFFRSGRLFKDCGYGTGRLTGTAVNTLIRVNIELLSRIKPFLILRRMDAVYRTYIHA